MGYCLLFFEQRLTFWTNLPSDSTCVMKVNFVQHLGLVQYQVIYILTFQGKSHCHNQFYEAVASSIYSTFKFTKCFFPFILFTQQIIEFQIQTGPAKHPVSVNSHSNPVIVGKSGTSLHLVCHTCTHRYKHRSLCLSFLLPPRRPDQQESILIPIKVSVHKMTKFFLKWRVNI